MTAVNPAKSRESVHVWNGVTVEERLSPNAGTRLREANVSALVLHADADDKIAESLAWIRNDDSDVSYHVMVGRKGNAYLTVPLEHVAWACGQSEFPQCTLYAKHTDARGKLIKVPGVNQQTISLCFSNLNNGKEPYSDAQYTIGAKLAAYIMRRFPMITLARITTHAIVAKPDGRKNDPLAFDMDRFKALVREELTRC